MAKDEGDIIKYTLCHLASNGAAGIIIADNMSSDNTMEEIVEAKKLINDRYPDIQVIIKEDKIVKYMQSEKMTALAKEAKELGAEWIIPFDIDEIWYSPNSTLIDAFIQLDELNYDVYRVLYTNHSITEYDKPDKSPFHSMKYKWDRPTNHKSTFKFRGSDHYVRISNGNHFVQHNGWDIGSRVKTALDDCTSDGSLSGLNIIQIRHFQWRSLDHFIKKITNAYNACKALESNHDLYNGAAWQQHFSIYEDKGIDGLIDFFENNILVKGDLGKLILDPAPIMETK